MNSMTPFERITLWISVLGAMIGGIGWLSKIHFTANANAMKLAESSQVKVRIFQRLNDVDQRLSRIEGMLKQMHRDEKP